MPPPGGVGGEHSSHCRTARRAQRARLQRVHGEGRSSLGAAARETRTPLTRILSPSAARERCGQHHTPRGRQRLSHTHRTQEQERLVRAQESSPGRGGAAVVKPCSRACFRHTSKGEQWRRQGGLCFGQQGRAVEERREGGGRAPGQRRNNDGAFHRRRRQQGSLTNVLLRQVRFVRHGGCWLLRRQSQHEAARPACATAGRRPFA